MIEPGGGKGGGTTKFICPHCCETYTRYYTCVRKHLCGIMPWDEGNTIGVKTCEHVLIKDRKNTRRNRKPHKTNPKTQELNIKVQKECWMVGPHSSMLTYIFVEVHTDGVLGIMRIILRPPIFL